MSLVVRFLRDQSGATAIEYGLIAAGISLAVIAVAGVFLAVRTNFDPAIGPARLIFGFEAVIIGGLGSMWGTLAGGIILGVSQAIGAQIDPGWQLLAGHLARVAEVNPQVGAITEVLAEPARAAAGAADTALARGETLEPLHGAPVTACADGRTRAWRPLT